MVDVMATGLGACPQPRWPAMSGGVCPPSFECGLTLLQSFFQAARIDLAWASDVNSVSVRQSSRSRPLNDPTNAFFVGLPGAM